jgi:hypothetical protein
LQQAEHYRRSQPPTPDLFFLLPCQLSARPRAPDRLRYLQAVIAREWVDLDMQFVH